MTKQTTWKAAAAAAAAVLALTACGTDDNGSASAASTTAPAADCPTGNATGAGSTFVATLAQQWIKDFGARCTGARITYQAVGSGAGVRQLTEKTVDFAGTDTKLSAEEAAAAPGAVTVPWAAGGIAVLVNVPGVSALRLSPATLAGIYAGTVKSWDDAPVKADNPGVSLPHTGVQVVHRSDGSGTTKVFTSYLTAVAGDVWKAGAAKDVAWPTGSGAKGSDGVATAVKQTAGSIGYAELSYAKAGGIAVASLRNAAGEFVAPEAANVAAALAEGDAFTATAKDAYPISTLTYVVARPGNAVVAAFVKYALTDGRAAAGPLYYAPLPDSVATKALADAAALA